MDSFLMFVPNKAFPFKADENFILPLMCDDLKEFKPSLYSWLFPEFLWDWQVYNLPSVWGAASNPPMFKR